MPTHHRRGIGGARQGQDILQEEAPLPPLPAVGLVLLTMPEALCQALAQIAEALWLDLEREAEQRRHLLLLLLQAIGALAVVAVEARGEVPSLREFEAETTIEVIEVAMVRVSRYRTR